MAASEIERLIREALPDAEVTIREAIGHTEVEARRQIMQSTNF